MFKKKRKKNNLNSSDGDQFKRHNLIYGRNLIIVNMTLIDSIPPKTTCLQAGKDTPGRMLWVVSIVPILLSLQAPEGNTGRRSQLIPPPLWASPSSSHPRSGPSLWEPEAEDTCDQRPVTWQPSQKASMPVARQGAGIYFPYPPVSSSRPLAPPGSLKEIHCPCFLSCLLLPKLGKQYSTNEKKRTSCPFVCCAGQRCCLLHCLFLHFWIETKRKK